jgi:hypothetical protein
MRIFFSIGLLTSLEVVSGKGIFFQARGCYPANFESSKLVQCRGRLAPKYHMLQDGSKTMEGLRGGLR